MVKTNEILPLEDVKKELLEFCLEPHNRETMLQHIQMTDTSDNYKRYVAALLNQRFIKSDQVRNRNSVNQKYVITQKGLNYLKSIT